MKTVSRFLLSLLFYCLAGVGISLTIIAGIGVSSFNALNISLSHALHMQVGVVITGLNGLFLLAYCLLSKGRYPIKYIVQAVAVICFGKVIDYFTYTVFAQWIVTGYAWKLLLFAGGTCLAGLSTGMVLNLDVIAFPIESVCSVAAERTRLSFAVIRYGVDIISAAGSVLLSVLLGLPLFVREGTGISLLLLTVSISLAKKLYEKQQSQSLRNLPVER